MKISSAYILWIWLLASSGISEAKNPDTDCIQQYTQKAVTSCIEIQKDDKNNLYRFDYYKKGEVILSGLASPGKPQKDGGVYTPEWVFHIKNKKHIHISRSYKNAKMRYALHLYKWIYIHAGKTNGKFLSHGCIRISKEIARKLYEIVPVDTTVIIKDTNPEK